MRDSNSHSPCRDKVYCAPPRRGHDHCAIGAYRLVEERLELIKIHRLIERILRSEVELRRTYVLRRCLFGERADGTRGLTCFTDRAREPEVIHIVPKDGPAFQALRLLDHTAQFHFNRTSKIQRQNEAVLD